MIYLSYRNVDLTARERVNVDLIKHIVQYDGFSEHSIFLNDGSVIHGIDRLFAVDEDNDELLFKLECIGNCEDLVEDSGVRYGGYEFALIVQSSYPSNAEPLQQPEKPSLKVVK